MEFNEKTYKELISWAKEAIQFKKIQNLEAADIVNDAYLTCVEKKLPFDFINGKKIAMGMLYGEIAISNSTDRNYLEFGQGNPNYKGINLPDISICKTCKESKPISFFYLRNGFSISPECKECARIRQKKCFNNPDKQIGINKTMLIVVKNEITEETFEAISLADLSQKTGYPKHFLRRALIGEFNSRAKVNKNRKKRKKELNFKFNALGINDYL